LRSAGEGEIGEQVGWRDAAGGTDAEEVDERDVLPASLEGADLVTVKVGALAESFLTDPAASRPRRTASPRICRALRFAIA
jgi:hypothetical protein